MFIETIFRTSSVEQHVSIPIPLYRGELDFRSAEGFEDIILREPSSGFPRLVIRRGEIGRIRITLRRLYTKETLWVVLVFHGTAPNFDSWTSLTENSALAEGVTYSINPSLLKFSSDEVYSSILTIAINPDAEIGSSKLTVETLLIHSSGEQRNTSITGLTGGSFTLEIIPEDETIYG
ncbi:MAG: hypothetical protein QXI36_01205 [Candidatus Bathyarchaeia archaeon]